jgi:hypothetical protein
MPGDLDEFLQRFLPAILLLAAGLAMGIIFWHLPKGNTGKHKPSQESYGRLRE